MNNNMVDTAEEKEPIAGLSAASSCIRISLSQCCLLSDPPPSSSPSPKIISPPNPIDSSSKHDLLTFRPVYTHQCFENECISGWRPLKEAEALSQKQYQQWKGDGKGVSENDGGSTDQLNNDLHPSYNHCQCSTKSESIDGRIDIHVILSPSCTKSLVEIRTTKDDETHPSMNDERAEHPDAKRLKTDSKKHVSFSDDVGYGCESQGGKKLDIKRIVQRLSQAVPPIAGVYLNGLRLDEFSPGTTEANNDTKDSSGIIAAGEKTTLAREKIRNGYIKQPLGQILKTYHRPIKPMKNETIKLQDDTTNTNEETSSAKFVIALAKGSDPSVAKYHQSVQPLARWFIETADDVDVSEGSNGDNGGGSGGFWSVIYLFREHSHSPSDDTVDSSNNGDKTTSSPSEPHPVFSLAGYITLFHFHAPFKKPNPGIIVRVCQALILPPYQRAGHGSELLHSVYTYADNYSMESSDKIDIVEVNVEDPAPGFVALRDVVDYHRFLSLVSFSKGGGATGSSLDLSYLDEHGVDSKECYSPISQNHLQALASKLKITTRQSQIILEMYKLSKLEEWKRTITNGDALDSSNVGNLEQIQNAETFYRLMVKRSLRSFRQEELGACDGGKEAQKALLGKWFDETERHYRSLLRSTPRTE